MLLCLLRQIIGVTTLRHCSSLIARISLFTQKVTPLFVLVSICLTLVACKVEMGGEGGWGKKKKDPPPAPAPVKVEVVTNGDISAHLRFHAVLRPEKEIQIFSRTIGIVTDRFVEEGDRVAEGQTLIKLDETEQKLTLSRALLNYENQIAEAARAETLFAQGMLPDDDIRQVRLSRIEAEITLDQAKLAFGYLNIQAPFSGIITRRAVDVGDRVDQSRPLFTMVDRKSLYADGWVSESELLNLHIGDKALVSSQSDTNVTSSAKLLRIAKIVDPTYGKVKVSFLIEGDQIAFKPGQFVELQLTLETHSNIVVVLKRALLFEAGEPVVYVVRDSLAFHQPIKTGIGEGGRIEILSGLTIGDLVVVEGHTTLRDSAKVRIQNPGH